MPFSLRGNDKRTNLERNRRRVDVRVRVRKLCTRCTVAAQTAAWCKGLCKKHARQQGLSPPHKSPKKGLSSKRKAKGKNPKGRRMLKALAAKLKTSVEEESGRAYRCKAKRPHALPKPHRQTWAEAPDILETLGYQSQAFEELPKSSILSIGGRKEETPPWSSPCICLAV